MTWQIPRFPPYDVGWRLGRAGNAGPELLVPALLGAPGAALVTLTKPEDLFLTLEARQRDGRPVAVLDPFDLAPGTPELVWDPVAG